MLVYGSKIIYKKVGYVADFCPLCSEVRQFRIERVGKASHLYFVSFGEGALIEYHRVCLHCHTQFVADPHEYRTLAKKPGPVAELVKETFHNLPQARGYQLQLARQVRDDLQSVPAEVRRQLLMQPFEILSPKVESRYSQLVFEVPGHYMRTEIYPRLAMALARLKPTEAELTHTLDRLRQLKNCMGRRVKLPALMAAIAAHGNSQPVVRQRLSRRQGGARPAGYMAAARTFNILSVVAVLTVLCMGISLAADLSLGEPLDVPKLIAAGVVAVLGALMYFVIAPGIARHQTGARIGGMVMSLAAFVFLPLTLYLLACLTIGWNDYYDEQMLAA